MCRKHVVKQVGPFEEDLAGDAIRNRRRMLFGRILGNEPLEYNTNRLGKSNEMTLILILKPWSLEIQMQKQLITTQFVTIVARARLRRCARLCTENALKLYNERT